MLRSALDGSAGCAPADLAGMAIAAASMDAMNAIDLGSSQKTDRKVR